MAVQERRPTLHRHLTGLVLALSTACAAVQASESHPPESYRPLTAQDLFDGIMEGGLASWVEDPMERMALSTFMATSYILGVADSTKGERWCPPEGFSMQTMSESVLDHLADLPEARLSEDAASVVAEALGKLGPCR